MFGFDKLMIKTAGRKAVGMAESRLPEAEMAVKKWLTEQELLPGETRLIVSIFMDGQGKAAVSLLALDQHNTIKRQLFTKRVEDLIQQAKQLDWDKLSTGEFGEELSNLFQ